jgi:hypothetical protein
VWYGLLSCATENEREKFIRNHANIRIKQIQRDENCFTRKYLSLLCWHPINSRNWTIKKKLVENLSAYVCVLGDNNRNWRIGRIRKKQHVLLIELEIKGLAGHAKNNSIFRNRITHISLRKNVHSNIYIQTFVYAHELVRRAKKGYLIIMHFNSLFYLATCDIFIF